MKQTKQALAESLKELLKRKPLERITVKDIVSGCGINRQSFYYHFCDVYDLMEWTLEEDIRKFFEALSDPPENWQEKVRLLFRYFYEGLCSCGAMSRKARSATGRCWKNGFFPFWKSRWRFVRKRQGFRKVKRNFL